MIFRNVGLTAFVFSIAVGNAFAKEDVGVYEAKERFIETLDKSATIHSRDLELRRDNLLNINKKKEQGLALSRSDMLFMKNIKKRYNVSSIDELLLSTDKVPTGIIISVAVKESEWGTNEKMKAAKNPFGIRCFSLGCGTKDEDSDLDDVYSELATFKSITDATRAFTRNINSNSQYSEFRASRKKMRDNGEYLTSLPLAEHLTPFTGDTENYGSELRRIIHKNKLYYLDE